MRTTFLFFVLNLVFLVNVLHCWITFLFNFVRHFVYFIEGRCVWWFESMLFTGPPCWTSLNTFGNASFAFLSFLIDFLHFVDFGQFFVKVGLVGVDGFFAVGREMILKDIGCVTMISDGIESAKGFGGFDFRGLLDDDLFFCLLVIICQLFEEAFNVHNS